jgi:hypothetical protein
MAEENKRDERNRKGEMNNKENERLVKEEMKNGWGK